MSKDTRGDDVIDSRDIIERFEELQSDRDDLEEAIREAREELEQADEDDDKDELQTAVDDAVEALETWDDADEYEALKALCSEGEDFADWSHGETLIREDYFTEYAEQLADDLGYTGDKTSSWPFNHIDWDAAADELKQDYSTVDFDGETYYIRS